MVAETASNIYQTANWTVSGVYSHSCSWVEYFFRDTGVGRCIQFFGMMCLSVVCTSLYVSISFAHILWTDSVERRQRGEAW